MKKTIYFILIIIQICLTLSLFFILPKTIDKSFSDFIVESVHTNLNHAIPNTLKIMLPADITIGEFTLFVTEYKQPAKMNNQIYSVAIHRLKNPEKIEETQNVKLLKYLSYQNFTEILDYQLFSPVVINNKSLIINLVIIIAIILILKIKNNINIPNKIKISLLIIILIQLAFINPLFALILVAYRLSKELTNNAIIKDCIYLIIIILNIYLIAINKISLGTALTTIFLFGQASKLLLKKTEESK